MESAGSKFHPNLNLVKAATMFLLAGSVTVNAVALYSARALAEAGRHGYRIFGVSLLAALSIFIVIEIFFGKKLSILDTKSTMMVMPVVLSVLMIITFPFREKAGREWPGRPRQGFLIIGSSVLFGVLLLFASDVFEFSRLLSYEGYHSVLFIGAMLGVTIPLLVEYALLVSLMRRTYRPPVLAANAGLVALYNLGLILFFRI